MAILVNKLICFVKRSSVLLSSSSIRLDKRTNIFLSVKYLLLQQCTWQQKQQQQQQQKSKSTLPAMSLLIEEAFRQEGIATLLGDQLIQHCRHCFAQSGQWPSLDYCCSACWHICRHKCAMAGTTTQYKRNIATLFSVHSENGPTKCVCVHRQTVMVIWYSLR